MTTLFFPKTISELKVKEVLNVSSLHFLHRNPLFDHAIVIPNSFKVKPVYLEKQYAGERLFFPLNEIFLETDTNVQIIVSISTVHREVNPADWVQIELDLLKPVILNRVDIYREAGLISDLLIKYTLDKPMIRRIAMVKDGQRIFRIDGIAPEGCYLNFSEDFLISQQTFKLINPEKKPTAEQIEIFTRDDPFKLSFKYPKSWILSRTNYAQAFLIIRLTTEYQGIRAGRLTLIIFEKSSITLHGAVYQYVKELEELGNHVYGADFLSISASHHIFSTSAKYNNNSQNVQALIVEHQSVISVLGLVCPKRSDSKEWWAINKRAFEIVRDSLQIE